jgi:hypothetical protein
MRRLSPLLVRQMNEVRARAGQAAQQPHACASPVCARRRARRAHAPLPPACTAQERLEDVARFCESAGVENAQAVSLLWVDRLGFDARALLPDGAVHDVRITFARQVEKEQDAISQLTLLAQQLWEAAPSGGRGYVPKPKDS